MMPKPTAPQVHVLTYCAHPTSAYGSLLVFDSIRIGFPNAQIEVFDNGSFEEVLLEIQSAAEKVGATFTAMKNKHYSDHLRWILLEREHPAGMPLIVSDPDVVYWEEMESLDFSSSLMAGRLIPEQENAGFKTMTRLHPSLLFIPDVHKFRLAAKRIESMCFAWDPIGPRTAWIDGQPHFWDTLSDLFNALKSECFAFGESELNRYDHLFFGTHLPMLDVLDASAARDMCFQSHRDAATGNIAALRGIWRHQQEFFAASTNEKLTVPSISQAKEKILSTMKEMGSWNGDEYVNENLWSSALEMIGSIRPQRKSV